MCTQIVSGVQDFVIPHICMFFELSLMYGLTKRAMVSSNFYHLLWLNYDEKKGVYAGRNFGFSTYRKDTDIEI